MLVTNLDSIPQGVWSGAPKQREQMLNRAKIIVLTLLFAFSSGSAMASCLCAPGHDHQAASNAAHHSITVDHASMHGTNVTHVQVECEHVLDVVFDCAQVANSNLIAPDQSSSKKNTAIILASTLPAARDLPARLIDHPPLVRSDSSQIFSTLLVQRTLLII